MSIKPNDEPQESPELPRREFLRLGIALPIALAAVSTLASAAAAAPPTAPTAPTTPTIGVIGVTSATAKVALGYWSHNATLVPGIAPSTLPVGDPFFEQSGARVLIHGTRSGIAGERQALLLDFFPDFNDGNALRVLAWAAGEVAMGSGDAVPNQPGGTAMQVPVQAVQGALGLVADFSGTLSLIVLSTGAARGVAKLQPGVYVVAAPAPGATTPPDLTQWMWKPKSIAEGMGQLMPVIPTVTPINPRPISVNAAASSAPSFPYMVIEVSYGTLG